MTDTATIVLFKNDLKKEVFLIFRTDYPIWVLPGGGMENNEKPLETAYRETFEETGFKTKIIRRVGIYLSRSTKELRKAYLFDGQYLSGKYRPEFPGNIGKWFSVNKLPFRISAMTKIRILDCLNQTKKPFLKKSPPIWVFSNIHLLLLQPLATIKYMQKSGIPPFKPKSQS